MKDGFLRVGTACPSIRVADPAYNVASHIAAARDAAAGGVRVLAFPELSLSAYTCSDLFYQEVLLDACETSLRDYIAATADLDTVSIVGVPVRHAGRLYNCAAVTCHGHLLGLVPKTHVCTYAEFYEGRQFTAAPAAPIYLSFAGEETCLFAKQLFACREMPALVLAAEICEDLWVADPPSNAHCAAGATLIANLSASDETVGKCDYRRSLIGIQSARAMCVYLYADAGCGESGTDMVFSGNCFVAEAGRILAESKPFSDVTLTVTEVDLKRAEAMRARTNTFVSHPDPTYRTVTFSLPLTETPLTRAEAKTPFVPGDENERYTRSELILDIQSRGLAGRVERSHSRAMVIGVSGGLDSTLALLVAARAADLLGLPRTAIVAVTMPCFGTTARTKSNAEKLSEKLGTTLRVIDIKEAVDLHFRDIGHDPADHSVVYENAQARERTQVLMDTANGMGGLVVGTGDLSELALGWATYNGDHMSMYGVNAGVPKTLVRYLVAFEADRFTAMGDTETAACLTDILATPVSPELLPPEENGEIAQKTEGIVGPYELHDFFLYYFVRFGFPPRKILRMATLAFADAYTEAQIKSYLTLFVRRFFAQQFKRSCLPDGPKVGSLCLSPRGDFRMPSDAQAATWLRELSE